MNNENQKPCLIEPGCAIEFNKEHFMSQDNNHTIFSFDEICEMVDDAMSNSLGTEEENFMYAGLKCSTLIPGEPWQKGRLKIRFEFIPDAVEPEPNVAMDNTQTDPDQISY